MLVSRRFLLSLGISMAFLTIFVFNLDINEVAHSMGKADYYLLIPALTVYFTTVLFRVIRWKYLLTPIKSIPVRTMYPIVVIGYMANNILPIRLGEIVRAHYIGERESISKTAALTSIAVERVFDALTLLLFIAVASAFLPTMDILHGLGTIAGIPTAVLISAMSAPFIATAIIMILFSQAPHLLDRITISISMVMPSAFRGRAKSLILSISQGLSALRNPRTVVMVFALSLPIWILEALMYYIIGFSFDMDAFFNPTQMWIVILLVTAIANLATAIPAAGGGIGTFDVAASVTLTILGLDSSTAGAYTIILHLALLIPITILGLIYQFMYSVPLNQMRKFM